VGEKLIQQNIERIERNLAFAESFFGRWPGVFQWRRPLAGSTALVGCNVTSVSALGEELAQQAGVLIQSAAMLGWDDQHMRIGLGREGFAVAIERFENWLEQNPPDR